MHYYDYYYYDYYYYYCYHHHHPHQYLDDLFELKVLRVGLQLLLDLLVGCVGPLPWPG